MATDTKKYADKGSCVTMWGLLLFQIGFLVILVIPVPVIQIIWGIIELILICELIRMIKWGGLTINMETGEIKVVNFLRTFKFQPDDIQYFWWPRDTLRMRGKDTVALTHKAQLRVADHVKIKSGKDLDVDMFCCPHAQFREKAADDFQAIIDELNKKLYVMKTGNTEAEIPPEIITVT